MGNYVKCAWANFDLETLPTNEYVIEHGTMIYTGIGGSSANYGEHYLLADAPVKLVWNVHGANKSLYCISENDGVTIYHACIQNNNASRAEVYGTTSGKGTTVQEWFYGGLDGYYSNVTYKFSWYHTGSYPNGWTDIEGTGIPSFYREDGRAHGQAEGYCDDDDWTWAACNYVEEPDPGPGTDPVEPEPTTDPVSPSGTIVVRVTASAGNPYEPGGESGIGQGNGTFANPDDEIDGPSLPQIGIADGTLIAMFNPTQSELNELGDYLFDDSIWTQAMRQLYGQPMDYILSLGIVPVHPQITSNKVEFSLGPAPVANLSMWQITRQYDEVDCGEITIPEYWGGFLDYEPYTSIQIYLPYIGYRELNPSECLNKPIHVYYHIDLFTGSCIAFIEVGGNILYQFEGNCLVQLPITSVQHAQMMSGIISALGFGATLVATKGLGMFGGMAGDFMTWGAGASAISSVANAAKPSVMHGGNTSASYGIMGIQTPYCIIRRPRQAIATDQNAYSGFASWYHASDFMFTTGFTKVAEIHLDGLAATDWEIQEIERLLKNGVIF